MNKISCGSCNSLGPLDPTYINQLSPRKNREIIREQIKDYIYLKLGAPMVTVELDEQQAYLAIDEALMIVEDYAPMEYFRYQIINTVPGQSVYELHPDVGMVRSVSYKETPQLAFSASDLGGTIPLEYMGAGAYGSIAGGINPQMPVWGKMGEWTSYKQYEDMYNRVSSQQGGWEFLGGLNHLKLYPIPWNIYPVVVKYIQKRMDWRETTQPMLEGALALAMIMLGRIRSRQRNIPGPNGGIQLDGEILLQEGKEMKEKWEQRLIDRWGEPLGPSWG